VIEGSLLLFSIFTGYDLNSAWVDTPPGGLRRNPLDVLKTHVRRRSRLEWSVDTFTVPFFEAASLRDGLLVGLGLKRAICMDLPSAIRNTRLRRSIHPLRFQPVRFALDPTQEVMVLVELYVV